MPPGWGAAGQVRLVRDAARAAQVPMTFPGLLEGRLLRSMANGRGGLDWTGIALNEPESAGPPGVQADSGTLGAAVTDDGDVTSG